MFALVVAAIVAQPPVEVPPPKDAPKSAAKADAKLAGPPEFDVQFADGSNIRAVVLEPTATVTTKFGKLDIPFSELRKVDFGFRYPAGVEAKVNDAVSKLGAAAFRDREEAEKELLAQKEYALIAVRRAAKGTDPEVVRRAEPLLKKLLALVPEDRQQGRDYDIVETNDFTVKGRLELTLIKVKTKQFGEVDVRVPEVRAFRALAVLAAGNEITLDAAKYGRLNWMSWFDTGLDVTAEQSLEVTAAGTIDQWPQEPGRYMSGPAGTQAQVAGPPQMVGPNGMMRGGMPNRAYQSGSLVARIGPTGVPFPVFAEYKQPKAGAAGRLFLIIAPSSWNNDNSTGTYKVKVHIGD